MRKTEREEKRSVDSPTSICVSVQIGYSIPWWRKKSFLFLTGWGGVKCQANCCESHTRSEWSQLSWVMLGCNHFRNDPFAPFQFKPPVSLFCNTHSLTNYYFLNCFKNTSWHPPEIDLPLDLNPPIEDHWHGRVAKRPSFEFCLKSHLCRWPLLRSSILTMALWAPSLAASTSWAAFTLIHFGKWK